MSALVEESGHAKQVAGGPSLTPTGSGAAQFAVTHNSLV